MTVRGAEGHGQRRGRGRSHTSLTSRQDGGALGPIAACHAAHLPRARRPHRAAPWPPHRPNRVSHRPPPLRAGRTGSLNRSPSRRPRPRCCRPQAPPHRAFRPNRAAHTPASQRAPPRARTTTTPQRVATGGPPALVRRAHHGPDSPRPPSGCGPSGWGYSVRQPGDGTTSRGNNYRRLSERPR